jgi:hypothetical protein
VMENGDSQSERDIETKMRLLPQWAQRC